LPLQGILTTSILSQMSLDLASDGLKK